MAKTAQMSLASFKRAEEKGRQTRINMTKKFEDTKKLRMQERESKEQQEVAQKKEGMLRRERYNELKSEFVQKMKN